MVKGGKNLPQDVRQLVVEAAKSGRSQYEIAKQFHCNQSTVSRLVKKYKHLDLSDETQSESPQMTTNENERTGKPISASDAKKTPVSLSCELYEEHYVDVSLACISYTFFFLFNVGCCTWLSKGGATPRCFVMLLIGFN